MAFPTFEEWKQQKREAEDQKYRAYEDNFRAYQAGEAVDLSKFEGGFSQADFDGWKQWHEQNKDRLDVEYTVKALDEDLVDAVRGQYQAQWGSKYYYDLFDPEDAARAAGGQMPKYLDGTYDMDNPYDRWLYDNGLPNRADFSDMYSQAAYDRQERWEENTSLLKGIEKDWNTVYDQKEAFQNAYNAALDETAQQSGRAPTQAEREALAQELLMSGKYDDIAAAYSALPDVRQEPDTLEAYVDRLEQPDYSAYDAMLQAMQDGTAVDDAFFDAYRQSDYDKWFSGQIAFTQQQLDDAYEQYLTDKQQKALEAQLRPGQEAASEIDKLLADGKASEAETKITDAIAALDERLAGFEQANELWERYRRAAIRNASVPTTDAFIPATPAREADLTGAIDDLEAKLQEEPERYGMDAADVATFVSLLRQRTLLQTQGRAAVSTVQAQAQQQERQDAIEREEQRVNDKYAALDEAKDFASKSVQSDEVLAALDDPYQQNMYRAVNRIMDEGYHSEVYGNYAKVAEGEPVMLSMWIHEGLTDEERARYNYLVATEGGAAGEQYIKDLKPQLQRRYAEVTDERQRQTAKELPVLSSLASVYMQFPAAVEGAIALAGTLGDEDYVAEHPELFSGTRFIQNVRESVAEDMSPTGQFFYQTGMSILDNVARLPLGKAGLGVMGGAVLSSTVNDYVAKGYSGGDALMLGVGSAAIEVLTEKISLDNLMRILKGGATRLSRSALQQAVKEAFQQSIYEGSEEMASEILNYFWESAVLDDGEYDQAVARYEAMGLTKNQAVAQALRDKLPDVLLSGAGGFLSGLVMGGGGSLIAEWRSDTAAGDGFGGNAVQQAQAGREIRLAYQEAVKENGRVLGDEAARQLKDDLQTLGVAKETARTVLQGVDMPNAWASDGLRTAMESVSETARSEAARVEARAARTEAAELKSSQRLGTLMEKFTAAQAQANAARAQNDLKGYLAAVEDMRGAVSNYQNALAVEEKAGEARQIETQEQTRKATAATERAVAAAQPAVQEGYARVGAEIATQRAAAEQFGAQQAAGQAQNAAGQAEAGPDQRTVTGQGDTGRGSDAPASTAKGAAQVDVMDELVRGAGTAVSAQETEGTGARARSVMEEVLAGTEEPGARPAGQGRRRYRAGVNRADTAGRLDAADRMQLRVLDGLGKKYGVKIVIEDTIRYEDGEGRVYAGTANAYYDRSDGTIHVALDAEGGAYLFFAVHELTHKLRAENANAYAALEAFVLNKLEASELYGALTQGEGGTLEERIASVRALYAARGLELSRGEALEELVCDAIPVILTDEQTVRELVRTDRTLAERIRDFFEEFYNELMRQLAGVVYGPGNRVEAAALMNDTETVRELAELFQTALESSADLQYELLTQSGSAIEEAENDKKRGRRLSARADGEDAITMEDVAAIQSIGRKSVNAFSSDEIRTAEPFARRYWRELGVKSPFFRAWFGDWRANDRTPVQLVRVAGADAPKSGRAINADTGRPISWGDRLRSETWAHGTKNALESIKGIDRIIETAVLLDTIAANQTGKSKLPGTAFMHSLYSLVDDGNGLTLYRLFAEEAVPVGGGDPFTRAYELKEIKKVATAPYGVLSVSGGLTNGAPATTYTIADLFAFVKENVPDFQPKPVHPAMLNADGTPRAVRQGVDATVEVLDGKTALQDGEAVYVKLENPYPAGTAAEVPERAALEAGGYDGAVYQDGNGGTHYAVLDGTQLKSATDNDGTFDGRNPNLRFSKKAAAEERDVAPAVSEKVLGNVAKRILQRTGSGYSAARLTDGLKTLLHTDAEQRRETADALARQVLAESRERDDRMYDRTLEARAYFRRGKFRLNETQKAEMAYRYNSYGNYRKSLMGKLNLVNSGGSYLDSVWGEICELFPEYFSPDTSEGDQPQKLKEFLDMAYARPEVNPYEQFHGMEDAAAALADELVETVENIGRRPAPERYLEDGRDAEAWEAYWSEVKAGAKGRPAVQRPATRSERLRRAWELFDNGMTPVQYWRQSREEARQASELRLFDDGRPAADTFDTKTSNLLRGLMLQNGERVGGALPDDELRRVMDITSRAKRRVAAALSLSAPVRVFEDVTGWGGDTAAERAQNVKDGNYLKDTYYEYGNLQAANRELWIVEKTRAVLEAVQGHGAYGVLESAVTQMLGERFVTEEQAGAAVSDGKTMIVEAQEGGVFVLKFGRDGKARLAYSSDGVTTTTYDEDFHDRVRRAAGKRSLRALLPVPKTEAGGLRVERLGGAVSVLTEDGKPVARVENGAHPNMPAVGAALGALQRFYADTYDEIAAVRVENGYAPPGHIEHYFPHQSRVYDGVEGFAEALMANDLPTGINGMTGTFSPGQPWNANLQQRFGTYTEFDAIRGFNRYVRGAADTIFYTPVIQRLRQLEQALRQQGTDALTAEDAGRNAALVDWVHEYANEWANKKASPDRGLESLLGREGYSVSGMLTSLVSQSSVGGSLSSAASNLIGGLTGMAQVDFKHALREGMRTTWQLLRRFDKRGGGYDGFADRIPFMQRRFSENEDILLTRPEQFRRAGSKALYALFSELDRWAVESVARAKYAECLDDGMTKAQAIAATNDLLIKNFADRGKGQAPRIFNVKAIKPVVQFQLEVLNQLHHFRDMDRAEVEKKLYELERQYGQDVPWDELEKKALSGGGPRKLKKVMAYLLLISLWGFLARALLGRDQTWNPLGMAADAVQDFREGGAEQAGAGLLDTLLDNVPFVSVLSGGGRVPLVSNLSNVTKAAESILFDKDFANADLVQAGTSFLPGGGQLRKTIQGAQANAAGGKYTKDGRLQYPIGEDDFWKTLLFGPSAAAPQGYDWTDALTKTETAAYETLVEQGYDPQDLYDTLLGYGGSTNAEKALSLLENRGEWDDGELNMIAELLGLDAGNDLERYAARETERYLSEKRKALAKGQITQQEYDRIEKRLTDQLADVQTGA